MYLKFLDIKKLRRVIRCVSECWRITTVGAFLIAGLCFTIWLSGYLKATPRTGTQVLGTSHSWVSPRSCSEVAINCSQMDSNDLQSKGQCWQGLNEDNLGAMASCDHCPLKDQFGSVLDGFCQFTARSFETVLPILAYRAFQAGPFSTDKRTKLVSQAMLDWLLRLLMMSSSHTLVSCITSMRYYIHESFGSKRLTRYLYEGGELIIRCFDDEPDAQIVFHTIKDGIVIDDKPISTPFKKHIPLKSTMFLEKTEFKCGNSTEYLKIKPFQCDPFQFIPPVTNCESNEICLLHNASAAKCGKKDPEDCFLDRFEKAKSTFQSPEFSVVCTTKDKNHEDQNELTQYGLCHARAVSNKTFEGLTWKVDQCSGLPVLRFNGESVKQDKLLFTARDPSTWVFEYDPIFWIIRCHTLDSRRNILVDYKIINYGKSTQLNENKPSILPSKLKFECKTYKSASIGHGFSTLIQRLISTFLIQYDDNPDLYNAIITLRNSSEPNALDVVCKCDIPEGFICKLSWKKPDVTSKPLPYAPVPNPFVQTLYSEDHGNTSHIKCFLEVFVFNTPVSYDLIRVPLIGVVESTTLLVTKNDFATAVQVVDGSINGSIPRKVDNSIPRKVDNSSNAGKATADDETKANTTAIAVGVTFAILALIIIAVIILFFVFRRRAKAKKQGSITSVAKEVAHLENDFVNKLQADGDHQVSEKHLAAFQDIKVALVARAQQLNPARPDFGTALLDFPTFANVKEEWESLERCRQARMLKTPPCVGYLLHCRYPNMCLTKASFVFKAFTSHLLSVEPTTEDIAQAEKDPATPTALNANFVKDLNRKESFILCQAPREKDMTAFLQMIVKEGVTLVVTLLAPNEPKDPSPGCRFYDYFTKSEAETATWGPFTLECTRSVPDPTGAYVTRQFKLSSTPTSITGQTSPGTVNLTVLSYLKWGDFSSPADCSHILSLAASMKRIHADGKAKAQNSEVSATVNQQLKTPRTVIHCAAGVGRSGGLMASYTIMEYLERHGCPINIHGIVDDVRCHREASVQTLEQYMQLYWVAAELARAHMGKRAPQKEGRSQVTSVVKTAGKTRNSSVAPAKSTG